MNNMGRYLISAGFFLFIFVLETSFISSLPSVFAMIPLVFGVGVYTFQHQGLIDGFVWIIAYGLLLQVSGMSASLLPFVTYTCVAFIAYVSARHLYSNRSLYGVMACGLTAYVTLVILEAFFYWVQSLKTDQNLFTDFFSFHGWKLATLLMTIMILFTLAKPIRILIRKPSY